MDSLFLLQFACFIFMLINAFIVALSHLHVRWENKRYERSRWMIVVALIGLAIQYAVQIDSKKLLMSTTTVAVMKRMPTKSLMMLQSSLHSCCLN